MGFGWSFSLIGVGLLAWILLIVLYSHHAYKIANVVGSISMTFLLVGMAGLFWNGYQKYQHDSFVDACRAAVKANTNPALVDKCRPHLAKIDAEEAAQKADWQARKERANADTIRTYQP